MKKTGILLFIALFVVAFLTNICANDSKPVALTRITDQIWIHTSYQMYNGTPTDANGLVAVTQKGLVLVDTCWDDPLTKELLTIAEAKFKQKFVLAIITHAHADRIGGIATLLEQGIEVVSTKATAEQAIIAGFKQPSAKLLDGTTELNIGGLKIETYFPGEAHTKDNIVVWFPDSKVLFAGCMVKSLDWNALGNVLDGNVLQYPISLKNLLTKYPDISVVVPGHGKWGNADLIDHTLKLCN